MAADGVTRRRVLALLVLCGLLFAAYQARQADWLERGIAVGTPWTAPVPIAPAADPAELAARERELAEQRRVGDLEAMLAAIRGVELIRDREQRCLAMPDPPGSQWPAGAVAARCALLRAPSMSLPVIRELLVRGRPSRLNRVHADLLQAHFDDPTQRERIFVAYRQFDGSRAAGLVADAWLRAAPRDPFALTAVGWQRAGEVAAMRGRVDDSRPPAERQTAMDQVAARAWPLLERALVAEPRLLPACVAMARLARLTGDGERRQKALDQCRAIDAESYHVLEERALVGEPEAGGTAAELEAVSAIARAGIDRHPALAGFVALPAIAAARAAPAERAAGLWDDALQAGPAPVQAWVAAADAVAAEQPLQALLLRTQAMRFDPCGDACHRRARLDLLVAAGNWSWARREAEALLRQAPDDWALVELLWQVRSAQAADAATLPVTADAPRWLAAVQACDRALAAAGASPAAARGCSEQLIADFPENPYAWYVRQRYLDAARLPGSAAALARLAATVDRTRPEQSALLRRAYAVDISRGR